MTCVLDTDTASYIIKKNEAALFRLTEHLAQGDKIAVSTISVYELLFGGQKKRSPGLTKRIEDFLSLVTLLDFDDAAAREAAEIRLTLEAHGTPSGPLDILIAASARASNAVLVTNNTQHFEHIPHLKMENWLETRRQCP